MKLTRNAVQEILNSEPSARQYLLQITHIKKFAEQKISQRLTLSDGVCQIQGMLLQSCDRNLNLQEFDVIELKGYNK